MKKILSVVLVVAVFSTMAVVAFAADPAPVMGDGDVRFRDGTVIVNPDPTDPDIPDLNVGGYDLYISFGNREIGSTAPFSSLDADGIATLQGNIPAGLRHIDFVVHNPTASNRTVNVTRSVFANGGLTMPAVLTLNHVTDDAARAPAASPILNAATVVPTDVAASILNIEAANTVGARWSGTLTDINWAGVTNMGDYTSVMTWNVIVAP